MDAICGTCKGQTTLLTCFTHWNANLQRASASHVEGKDAPEGRSITVSLRCSLLSKRCDSALRGAVPGDMPAPVVCLLHGCSCCPVLRTARVRRPRDNQGTCYTASSSCDVGGALPLLPRAPDIYPRLIGCCKIRAMAAGFGHLFNSQAAAYAAYRPHYPPVLYQTIFSFANLSAKDVAVDIATGTGQAARVLAQHFTKVTMGEAAGNW